MTPYSDQAPALLVDELDGFVDAFEGQHELLRNALAFKLPLQEALSLAKRAPPLSRCYFVTELSRGRPRAEAALLCAMVRAHADVAPFAAYEAVKAVRQRINLAWPSLAEVSAALPLLFERQVALILGPPIKLESLCLEFLEAETMLTDRTRHEEEALGRLKSALKIRLEEQIWSVEAILKASAENREVSSKALLQRVQEVGTSCVLLFKLEPAGPSATRCARAIARAIDKYLATLDRTQRWDDHLQACELGYAIFAKFSAFDSSLESYAKQFKDAAERPIPLMGPAMVNEQAQDRIARDPATLRATVERKGRSRKVQTILLASGLIGLTTVAALQLVRDGDLVQTSISEGVSEPQEDLTEIAPPQGREIDLTRANLRYCHFQKERLLLIKRQVSRLEDVDAFNTLANDYSSRCTDFLYQEEDMKVVRAQALKRAGQFQADARRIVANWPWRGDKVAPAR